MKKAILTFLGIIFSLLAIAQDKITGEVLNAVTREPVAGASIRLKHSAKGIVCDEKGSFQLPAAAKEIIVSATGYEEQLVSINDKKELLVLLAPVERTMDAVVVTGTMKPMSKLESPVAVEVYTPQFLKKNPTPSIFESLQNVNGVRPQLNCSVCNTGDIHINGLEGPYTMITIDGMPIVSSLASVYGLFGIPTQLIDRVEIVKGPASGLYGAEAIGGLINIITKTPDKAPLFTANFMTTSWLEHNLDLGVKFKLGNKVSNLLGVNYFNYQHPLDKNNDQFTDVTLQHRISFFNKLSIARKNNRVATLAARYFYEDRWGGDMRWNSKFRGTDSIYGESIYTNRWELIGNYQLPINNEKMFFSFSATSHDQNSYYGTTPYMGKQKIGFGQLLWDRSIGASHSLLTGLAGRYTYYDDNSTATLDTLTGANKPDNYFIPGIFVQDEWKIGSKHLLLTGLRYDHHPVHKGIITPRLAWKWALKEGQVFRLNAGTGFRVVSLFTEEHAALTGARAVEVLESLDPEQSYNVNLNYTWYKKWNAISLNADISTWYSHFTNQIIADYDTDPNKIIYKNLDGYASSKGVTLNLELNIGHRFKSMMGATVTDVKKVEKKDGIKSSTTPVLTDKWSGTWAITYTMPAAGITIDYTGNLYGPMRLPLLSATDPRPGTSPVWSIQNIQVTKLIGKGLELFAGVKNLLNWTPAKSTPFIIARSHDPFDKKVQYDPSGNVLATPENPYALTFDPSYAYAPNQGLRVFGGVRYMLRK